MPKCVPSDYVSTEKNLGIATSIVSGGLAYLFMYLLEVAGVEVGSASAITSAATNFIGYSLDVLLAKQCFAVFGTDGEKNVTLGTARARFLWYARSLVSFSFVRFCVTVVIDIIVTLFVLRYAQEALDDAGVLTEWRWRDPLLAVAITFVNFHLFVNRLRFEWAYAAKPDPAMDVVMYSWFSSLVVSHIIFKKISRQPQQQDEKK
jgi:hypothetical protein